MTDNILYIDSNEPTEVQATVETTIKDRQNNVATQKKGLKTADFVYKDTAIERKEASDLASSIKDGRLKQQTIRMREDFNHQYIIVEGNPYNLEYSSLHPNAFVGTMVSRSSEGISIIYTADQKGTAYAINKIIEKHEEGEEKVEELKKTKAETEDTFIAMLTCIKGVSKEKAERIREVTGFESIGELGHYKKVCDAGGGNVSPKYMLQEVDGIGEKLSERIISEIMEA